MNMFKTTLRFLSVAIAVAMSLQSCKSEYEALLNGNDVDAKYAPRLTISTTVSTPRLRSFSSRCLS